jgi:8-oxo-dGTP pyrophosphatase MutT (NUDIX family)
VDFLARFQVLHEHHVVWGETPRLLRYGACADLPPLELVTSVRAVLFDRDGDVMVLRDEVGHHLLPGGRREVGETLGDTLTRELLEETGWRAEIGAVVGHIHVRNLCENSPDPTYPHPDFFQTVFLALAVEHVAGARREDDIEQEAVFRSLEMARNLVRNPGQLAFLAAALSARREAG